jgi:hypothetical protein
MSASCCLLQASERRCAHCGSRGTSLVMRSGSKSKSNSRSCARPLPSSFPLPEHARKLAAKKKKRSGKRAGHRGCAFASWMLVCVNEGGLGCGRDRRNGTIRERMQHRIRHVETSQLAWAEEDDQRRRRRSFICLKKDVSVCKLMWRSPNAVARYRLRPGSLTPADYNRIAAARVRRFGPLQLHTARGATQSGIGVRVWGQRETPPRLLVSVLFLLGARGLGRPGATASTCPDFCSRPRLLCGRRCLVRNRHLLLGPHSFTYQRWLEGGRGGEGKVKTCTRAHTHMHQHAETPTRAYTHTLSLSLALVLSFRQAGRQADRHLRPAAAAEEGEIRV